MIRKRIELDRKILIQKVKLDLEKNIKEYDSFDKGQSQIES